MSKVKIAMCWDDGVSTDIRLVSILRKYHAKATFNLNPGNMPEHTTASFWKAPGDNGWSKMGFRPGKVGRKEALSVYGDFTIACHNNRHETVGRCTNQEFLQAALDGRKALEDMFQKPCKGFAWPCGVTSPETVAMLRDAGFVYGRTCANAEDITACTEPLLLPSCCHFQSDNFYDFYEKAKRHGVFYFWGHSYETLDYEPLWKQLEDKIAFLSNDPDTEWVDVIDLIPLLTSKTAN